MAAAAGAAVALSGLLSLAAAQAFKGHQANPARATRRPAEVTSRPRRVHVPAPQRIPAIAGQPEPLQPPAQPPAAAAPAPTDPAPADPVPAPQVSSGS